MRFTLNSPMNNETFELFFAMLSVALLAGTVVVLVARLLAGSQTWAASTIAAFRPFALPLAAAVTTTCLLEACIFPRLLTTSRADCAGFNAP